MASAGTVTVDFAAETARFTAELKKVQGSLKRIEGDFKSMEKVAGVALRVFSGAVLANFAKQAFAAADATATAAERAGIAVETFSRLQYAAGQTDVEMGALTTGVQRFQIALSKSDEESKQAIATLSRFGLQAENLKNLSIEDQLAAVAEAFTQISNPADRTRVAVDLFGKSAGPQLVPLLAQGKAGIQQLTAEADRLGITMSGTTAAGIDQADRAIKQLTQTLSSYTSKFIAGLSIVILGPPDEVQRLDNEIERLQERVRQITQGVGGGDPAKVLGRENPLVKEYQEANAEIDKLLNKQRELLGLNSSGPASKSLIAPVVSPVQEIDIAAIQAMKIEVDELAIAYQKLTEAVAQVSFDRMREIAAAVSVETATAQNEVEQQITNDLEFQLQARSLLQESYRQQEIGRELDAANAMAQARSNAYSSTITALRAFAGQSEKTAKALVLIEQGRALANAIMNTHEAVTLQLSSGDPYTAFARAAAAGAYGAIQVAAIAATAYGQFKSISANGGAPIGSPVNPAVTTPADSSDEAGAESLRAIQVIVANNVGLTQRQIDEIISGIREAADDRDVIIFGSESRQAREIVGG
jgi:hypothetical protein